MIGRPKDRDGDEAATTISIVGPSMEVMGDCATKGTLRVEGRITGNVYASKAVVVGKAGVVQGDIRTQDAVISGVVEGVVRAASRLEVRSGARIAGEVHARRLQLDEGGVMNAEVRMGEIDSGPPPELGRGGPDGASEGAEGGRSREPDVVTSG